MFQVVLQLNCLTNGSAFEYRLGDSFVGPFGPGRTSVEVRLASFGEGPPPGPEERPQGPERPPDPDEDLYRGHRRAARPGPRRAQGQPRQDLAGRGLPAGG